MQDAGIGNAALASALKPEGADDNKPRSLVKAWCEGESVPTAFLVFDAGEALRTLGVDWCSGPIALYAAGYRAEFVRFIAALAPISRDRAVIFALLGGTVADPIAFAGDEEAELARAVVAEVYDRKLFAEAWRLALLTRRPPSGAPRSWRLTLAEQVGLAADAHADETVQQFLDAWAGTGSRLVPYLAPLISDEHRRLLAWGAHQPPCAWTVERHCFSTDDDPWAAAFPHVDPSRALTVVEVKQLVLSCVREAIAGRGVPAAPVSPNPESVALLAAQRPRKENRS